jgi:hypothetical protein
MQNIYLGQSNSDKGYKIFFEKKAENHAQLNIFSKFKDFKINMIYRQGFVPACTEGQTDFIVRKGCSTRSAGQDRDFSV